jgi:hypothetical protein
VGSESRSMTSEVVCLDFPRDTSIRLTQCVDSFMVEVDHRAERFGTIEPAPL